MLAEKIAKLVRLAHGYNIAFKKLKTDFYNISPSTLADFTLKIFDLLLQGWSTAIKIAEKTGLSEKTVKSYLHALERYIVTAKRRGFIINDGSRVQVRYYTTFKFDCDKARKTAENLRNAVRSIKTKIESGNLDVIEPLKTWLVLSYSDYGITRYLELSITINANRRKDVELEPDVFKLSLSSLYEKFFVCVRKIINYMKLQRVIEIIESDISDILRELDSCYVSE